MNREKQITEDAIAFENQAYPHATPETRRLLAQSRGAIIRFLESELGRGQIVENASDQ